MKRKSAGACVVAIVLLLPVVASASDHRFRAPLQGGVNNAGLEFGASIKNGDPKDITKIEWHNVNCGGPYAGTQTWHIDVNGAGKFHKTHAIQDGYAGSTLTLTGKFKSNQKVVGTFSVSPTPGCAGGTGELNYTAHPGPQDR